jgi:hypothetical protein
MQAAKATIQSVGNLQMFMQCLAQHELAGAVEPAHAPQMAAELPTADEIGQRQLVVAWTAAQQLAERRSGGRQKLAWQHDKPQAQGRKQGLAEGADIEHRSMFEEALDRSNRAACVAEFTVVIVFDDPGTVVLRGFQQAQAARGAHDRTGWVLV